MPAQDVSSQLPHPGRPFRDGEADVVPVPLMVENLTVRLGGVQVVEQVSFTAGPGCLMGVVGPNGAGKSTLFNAIVGLLPLDTGRVLIHGRSVRHARGCIAYVPQQEKVNWRLPVTAYEVVMQGRIRTIGWLRRVRRVDRDSVDEALEQVGMTAYRSRLIRELSGGQRQRIFVARALAQEADVLLLDEAFSGTDIASQESLVAVLQRLRDQARTILLSSHNVNHVAHHCDRCLCLNCRVCACGIPHEVLTPEVLRGMYGPILASTQSI